MAPKSLMDFISESQHTMKAHLRHFYTLTLLFFFPICSSFILSLTLFHFFNLHQRITANTNPSSLIIFLLLYSLFVSLFSTCGVISITYSVFHFFNGKLPVNLQSSIRSIPVSFLPLLATNLVSQAFVFCISLLYALLLVLLTRDVAELVRGTGLFFAAFPLLIVLIYMQVNWSLVPAIVVVESCWGLEPLRSSARLIKGMKGVALSSFFFYGFCTVFSVLSCLSVMRDSDGSTENWFSVVWNWVYIVLVSLLLAMIMLSNIGVNTVLYIYCKANNGEIVEEFGREYVSLPFHDGNITYSV